MTEEGASVSLNSSGDCQVGGQAGTIPSDAHSKVWERLTVDLDVTSLSMSQLRMEYQRELRKTKLVGSSDPIVLTHLEIDVGKETTVIDFPNLEPLHRAYPDAQDLARLYAVSQVLKGIAGQCDIP